MKKYRYAPTRFPSPIILTWLSYLTLYACPAPGWLWGASSTILLIIWIACIVARRNDQQVDISGLPDYQGKKDNVEVDEDEKRREDLRAIYKKYGIKSPIEDIMGRSEEGKTK